MPRSPEEKFLHEARKGVAYWRLHRILSLLVSAGFALGSVWQLWQASQNVERGLPDLLGVLAFVAASVAAGMWQVHAEVMQGAAHHMLKQALREPPL